MEAPDGVELATPAAEEEAEPASLRLEGRVVTPSGQPIEGARLELVESAGRSVIARSDAEGRVVQASSVAPSGQMSIEVLAQGYEGRTIRARSGADGVVRLGTVELQPGVSIHGVVVGDGGVPLVGAEVTWLPAASMPNAPQKLRELAWHQLAWSNPRPYWPLAYTDADGSFELSHVATVPGFLVARATGHAFGYSEVHESHGWPVPVTLWLGSSELVLPLAGIVIGPHGRPFPGAEVELLQTELTEQDRRSTTGADGRFEFQIPASETVVVRVTDPAEEHYPVQAEGVAGRTDLRLQLFATHTADLTIVDPDGLPIPWSTARILEADLLARHPQLELGEESRAQFVVPRGEFRVQAFGPGYRDETFDVHPNDVSEQLTLTLQPGEYVAGQVLFEGEPLVGARVARSSTPGADHSGYAMNVATAADPFTVLGFVRLGGYDAETDSAGLFVFSLHNDGWHTLLVTAEGFPPSVFGPYEWNRGVGVQGVVLELERGGSLEGEILRDPGEALHDVPIAITNGWGIAYTTATDGNGRFRFDNLQPGGWQVREGVPPLATEEPLRASLVEPPSGPRFEPDVHVYPGGEAFARLDCRSDDEYELRGQLTFNGAPVPGWQANLFPADGSGSRFNRALATAALDDEGRFVLRTSRSKVLLLLREGQVEIHESLQLDPTGTAWSLNIEAGRVQLSCAPESTPDSMLALQATVGNARWITTVWGNAFTRKRTLDRVPLGSVRLTRYSLLDPFAQALQDILNATVDRDQTASIHLDQPLPD